MKKTFLTGLVTLLPLAVTFYVVNFVVNFLTTPFLGIFLPLLSRFISSHFIAHFICQILVLLFLFLFIACLGFVARRIFFHSLIKFGDSLMKRIPLVNKVYKTSKDIIRSLFSGKEQSFKQVVMLTFPYKNAFCIGLITSGAPETASNSLQEEMVSVFIPTTPNPTTGYLVLCCKKDLIFLDMKSEDAVKYVVSCGVIQPKRDE